ncbi:TerD family protein [Streptomyces sp. DSM 44917]|uniref:TerD family protein n=1 Tax=Streptomyces boetiae TaxID=3075541 RepID=A0ABU2LD78_9ACTN|nr:TerD family protein [Streptomyces sp. DSM 44917]MDT0309531.1 TerD family protein [Streptomyces sp. DSM 44917]
MTGPSSALNKGVDKVQVMVKWDPSPLGAPAHDLDLIAATYRAEAPHGEPAYLVHFDSRSPDGTITLNRDSSTGQGLGFDEVLTLELERLAPAYGRVVVGVAIQQGGGRKTFGDVSRTQVRIVEGYDELATDDFGAVAGATAATVAEFARREDGSWSFRPFVRGFDADPAGFAATMGSEHSV